MSWTEITRRQYRRDGLPYASDLTDAEWACSATASSSRPAENRSGRGHPFDRSCRKLDIEHRLTKSKHPWTNGQVERMNRALKEATVKRFHYETSDQPPITPL